MEDDPFFFDDKTSKMDPVKPDWDSDTDFKDLPFGAQVFMVSALLVILVVVVGLLYKFVGWAFS